MPTPAEFSAEVESIKDSIATIVAAVAPNAVMIKRLIWNPDPQSSHWLADLKNPADVDANGNPRIHAIQIWYEALSNDEDRVPNRSVDPVLVFWIGFFHAYDIGTDADNSEKRIMKEISEVFLTLAAKPDLDLDYTCRHTGLRMRPLQARQIGQEQLQWAVGRLEVRMNSQLVV